MRYLKYVFACLLAALLVACGGGGNPGGTSSGGSGGGSTTGPTMTLELLSGAGVSASALSTVEIGTARATLKDASGAPIKGVIVTFTGGSLLTVSPVSATALTDESGHASVEVRANSTTSQGAVSIGASAVVSTSVTVTAQKAISITSAPTTGVVNPQALANALNFLDINPSDKSIVLAGSGGNGRSESATLRFRVVDNNNTPVQGAVIDFSVVPASVVTLNIVSATSDSDGVVLTTVSSKNVATAVVVKAVVNGRSITSQSDQLLVTTGVATQAGFDLSASKFNLNSAISGDSSVITVRIRDANGNPVADGVPVVFTSDYGAVGSSSQGGCVTLNGLCTVNYVVQNPRPPDGQLITVIASTQVGSGVSISDNIQLSAVNPGSLDVFDADDSSGVAVTELDLAGVTAADGVCTKAFPDYFVGTAGVLAAPANTAVTLAGLTTGLTAAVVSGSPILDSLVLGVRTPISFTVAMSTTVGTFPCVVGGTNGIAIAPLQFKFTSGTIVGTRTINVKYRY
ncbi:protocatechuate 3,4-dioxygenase beta subunit [Rhodoferax ferrireducens]|uniref:Protocatechuate 3,4-dioxygenase beta subunit n=1 Tax=Rhodoferax ferrireducens TaxID=192843 RepID=A0ABU2CFJ7_9BURK|nr:hypothetical protein [Rhodoferax ferrireducens]MDR7380120.1 protocatechuate 3,4-dioxygenase beta subunit [Rhodoferax ferrireducens]